MKFFICALALVASAYAAPQYGATNPQYVSKEGTARILNQDSVADDNGGYRYRFDTENGITVEETNVPKPAGPNGEPAPSVQGGYRYTAPDGQVISIVYSADGDGFRAEGDAIPRPPAIPEEILKSLEWNAAHPDEETLWDPASPKFVGKRQ
ncbi:endocuticle structural glycoprotein SgAbd-1-like [Diprion similis]|uniref:endocuticle structural glycoprotein SgAbd-1-like n=1 Tax=Diprion similis TaxID=362088 RepID=UPI001EF7E1A2|nr:endocuticle structural glycoprotein SgAbd-1-like [Diprion similis]